MLDFLRAGNFLRACNVPFYPTHSAVFKRFVNLKGYFRAFSNFSYLRKILYSSGWRSFIYILSLLLIFQNVNTVVYFREKLDALISGAYRLL